MDPVRPSSFNAFLSLTFFLLHYHYCTTTAVFSPCRLRILLLHSHDSYIGNGKLQHERM